MDIHPPRPEDLPQLLALVQGLARFHGDTPRTTLAQLTSDVMGPCPWFHVLVGDEGGQLLGYVALLRLGRFQYGQRGVDIHHLFVAEGHRQQGIGRQLVVEALVLGGQLGATYATVTATPANTAAQAFYKRLGFADAPRFGTRFWTPIPEGTRFA